MNLSRRKRLTINLTSGLLVAVFATLAYFSTRYPLQTDLTYTASNTLSVASQKLLTALPDAITITAYIKRGQPIRMQIADLVDRYRVHKNNLSLVFKDPDENPEKVRELNIGTEGIVLIGYQGRTEKLSFVDEAALSNALLQIASAKELWVTFLGGHGERSPDTAANFDFSQFAKELQRRNINAQTLNLSLIPAIPDNSAVLVIASPATPLPSAEMAVIKQSIDQGGNLLILTDPDPAFLSPLLAHLGLEQQPGAVMDNSSKPYGINDPGFILASTYGHHPVTQGLQTMTLYPNTAALKLTHTSAFNAVALLTSSAKAWLESPNQTAPQTQPLVFGYALTRTVNTKQQRIVVIGDGDFLANAYIGNVGNLDMGLRLLAWLSHEDRFIDIPAKIAHDKTLQLSATQVAILGFGFLVIMPIVLVCAGLIVWRARKD